MLKDIDIKLGLLDKLIVLFFIYILFTGLWNTIEINFLKNTI